jgi:hypothetical protein
MGPSARPQDQSGCHCTATSAKTMMTHSLNKEASQIVRDAMRCRVEDGYATAEDWEDSYGVSLPADCFWNDASGTTIAADDEGPCMGIELNIWERAKVTIYFNNSIYIIDVIVIVEVIDNICSAYRYCATSCTRWWVVVASMGDLMRLITEKLSTGTQASWENMPSFQCCPTSLRGFYLSFMISGSQASIFHHYQLIVATLMCMVQLITIRHGSCCICAHVINMLVIVII